MKAYIACNFAFNSGITIGHLKKGSTSICLLISSHQVLDLLISLIITLQPYIAKKLHALKEVSWPICLFRISNDFAFWN